MSTFPYTVPRADWEEDGWEVGAHTGSPAFDWGLINNFTIHYPAAVTVPAGPVTRDMMIGECRRLQRSYVNGRGYSVGYSANVWGGLSGELRGDRWRAGSNGFTAVNRDSFTCQIRVPGQSPNQWGVDTSTEAGPADIAEVNRMIAWAERQADKHLPVLPFDITGHRDHKPTGCPGDAIYQQIMDGVFYADEGDTDMRTSKGRILETRPEYGGAGAFRKNETRVVDTDVSGTAVTIQITVIDARDGGWVTVWPDGQPMPADDAAVAYVPGETFHAGTATVEIPASGKLKVYSFGRCHMTIDRQAVFG